MNKKKNRDKIRKKKKEPSGTPYNASFGTNKS